MFNNKPAYPNIISTFTTLQSKGLDDILLAAILILNNQLTIIYINQFLLPRWLCFGESKIGSGFPKGTYESSGVVFGSFWSISIQGWDRTVGVAYSHALPLVIHRLLEVEKVNKLGSEWDK